MHGALAAALRRRRGPRGGAGVRRLGPGLAGLSGLRRGARLSEAALSAGDPVQHRSRLLCAQRAQARGRVRRGLHRAGHRLVQARSAQFRVHAGPPRRAGHRARADPAHGRSRCITTTSRPSASASPPAGSTGAPGRRAPARRGRRRSRCAPISASRRSPKWPRRTGRRSAAEEMEAMKQTPGRGALDRRRDALCRCAHRPRHAAGR